jgi:hypothetical protein
VTLGSHDPLVGQCSSLPEHGVQTAPKTEP